MDIWTIKAYWAILEKKKTKQGGGGERGLGYGISRGIEERASGFSRG